MVEQNDSIRKRSCGFTTSLLPWRVCGKFWNTNTAWLWLFAGLYGEVWCTTIIKLCTWIHFSAYLAIMSWFICCLLLLLRRFLHATTTNSATTIRGIITPRKPPAPTIVNLDIVSEEMPLSVISNVGLSDGCGLDGDVGRCFECVCLVKKELSKNDIKMKIIITFLLWMAIIDLWV